MNDLERNDGNRRATKRQKFFRQGFTVLLLIAGIISIYNGFAVGNSSLVPITDMGTGTDLDETGTGMKLDENATTFKPTSKLQTKSKSDKWIVITSINDVTNEIRRMATLKNWRIVVVGDRRTPDNWHNENCEFLSLRKQATLGYALFDLLPFNSYSRKVLGYLYAIEHGARFIYDTDDDNDLLSDRLQFDFDESAIETFRMRVERKLTINDSKPVYWNPYAHFGRPDAWPRGFPLQRIQMNIENGVEYYLRRTSRPSAVQQGLVDRDPDVDAIYRLVYFGPPTKDNKPSPSIYFDPHAPPVQLGRGVYTPFNTQNTLFRYDAFWALYVPMSVSVRVCDIWRGYWAMRLLPEIDETLAFRTSSVRGEYRNVHDYFRDFMEEKDLYERSYALIDLLHSWKCENDTIAKCALDLATAMAVGGFWSHKDVRGIETWFEDLKRLGYVFPPLRKPTMSIDDDALVSFVSKQAPRTENLLKFDRFSRLQTVTKFCASDRSTKPLDRLIDRSIDLTQSTPPVDHDKKRTWFSSLRKIILIVVINDPSDDLSLMRTLYEPWFANTIFCSTKSSKNLQNLQDRFSFIQLTRGETQNDLLGYECLARVIEMRMQVDGYLVIGDDVLLNFWTSFDFGKPQFVQECGNSRHPNATKNAIEKVRNDRSIRSIDRIDRFDKSKRLSVDEALAKNETCKSHVYYVPGDRADEFLTLANGFLRSNTPVDSAVPKILKALGWRPDLNNVLRGTYIKDRQQSPISFFNASHHFLHPLKIRTLAQSDQRSAFCNSYVQSWIDIMVDQV